MAGLFDKQNTRTQAPPDRAIMLSCPSCGARLEITEDIDRFACLHCGNEQIVRRRGGIVSLAPVVEGLGRVQRGTDLTAAELAIARLSKEVDQISAELERWEKAAIEVIAPPTDMEKGLRTLVIIFGLSWLVTAINSSPVSYFLFLLFLITLGVLQHMRYKRRSNAQTERQYEVDTLGKRRFDKVQALHRNQRIVDG